jgi:hypothetical protein
MQKVDMKELFDFRHFEKGAATGCQGVGTDTTGQTTKEKP